MARATGIDDLFGHVPQAGELALPHDDVARDETEFDCGSHLLVRPPRTGQTKDTIREGLNSILSFARTTDSMPWDDYYLRYYSGMFVYMAEFKVELDWLGAPPEHMAPIWQRIWGIAA